MDIGHRIAAMALIEPTKELGEANKAKRPQDCKDSVWMTDDQRECVGKGIIVGNNFDAMRIWCIFTSNKYIMARQSISFTKPNDEWLKSQVDKKEYSSKSELVNDLIRQARKQQVEINWVRAKLEKAENSGFTNESKNEILAQSKSLLND